MAPDPSSLESGELTIFPESGRVLHASGAATRLGPVNMKVLRTLIQRDGAVVTRAELFEAVWGHQIVGDDALTRCISDIRGELRTISGRDDLIETLPKRGYRWRRETPPAPDAIPIERAPPMAGMAGDADSGRRFPRLAARLAMRGFAYLIALTLMASLIVWTLDLLSKPDPPVVAMLPMAAPVDDQDLAARLEMKLHEQLLRFDAIRVLSQGATESRPANPFPYFYEFGARWVIESQLRKISGERTLTVALVDARTGIVLKQTTAPLAGEAEGAIATVESLAANLRATITAILDE